MNRETETDHQINELIESRWSPRSFSEKPVSEEDIKSMFEAARWSFSCANYQPWNYFYAMHADDTKFEKLFSCLTPGNQKWANNAAILIVGVIKRKFDNGELNEWAKHDLGAANMSLALQGQSMAIYSHFMAGFDKQQAITALNLDPEEFEPVTFAAVGYLDSPGKLAEPYKTRETAPRKRKELIEFVHQVN